MNSITNKNKQKIGNRLFFRRNENNRGQPEPREPVAVQGLGGDVPRAKRECTHECEMAPCRVVVQWLCPRRRRPGWRDLALFRRWGVVVGVGRWPPRLGQLALRGDVGRWCCYGRCRQRRNSLGLLRLRGLLGWTIATKRNEKCLALRPKYKKTPTIEMRLSSLLRSRKRCCPFFQGDKRRRRPRSPCERPPWEAPRGSPRKKPPSKMLFFKTRKKLLPRFTYLVQALSRG